ncbi:hypothetical protein Cycma_5101 [Cyclobacterium marinum DSM 745]|uniref:Uncharacterized protein n=1 Tax=Cyclobacterium marinum (strain ATCC 25205 / DSM 745 / LMG 13164 / NCIMB 1802) TaxID=880070 RepID=G0J8I5_CYCMS|nr:hypothetical protein Cycma_5101 [Cyclobacterium marinum DSM 745]
MAIPKPDKVGAVFAWSISNCHFFSFKLSPQVGIELVLNNASYSVH